MQNDADRPIPAPVPTQETKAFWMAAAEGKFLIKRCLACDRTHWYPRTLCPFCLSDKTDWYPATGKGIIYSFSVMRRTPQPYAIAFVTLEEGPTMLSNLVDCDFALLAIGQKVSVVFKPSDGDYPVPVFTPCEA